MYFLESRFFKIDFENYDDKALRSIYEHTYCNCDFQLYIINLTLNNVYLDFPN